MSKEEVTPKYLLRSIGWMVSVIVGATLLAVVSAFIFAELLGWVFPFDFDF